MDNVNFLEAPAANMVGLFDPIDWRVILSVLVGWLGRSVFTTFVSGDFCRVGIVGDSGAFGALGQ